VTGAQGPEVPRDGAVNPNEPLVSKPPSARVAFSVLRFVVVVGIVAGILYATFSNWAEVKAAIAVVPPLSLVLAFMATALGIFSGVRVWHVVLQEMGSDPTFIRAAQVNLVGLLGKYLPGSVWAYVLQTELSNRAGIPRARAFVALLVATGVSAVSAFAMAPLALPLVEEPLARLALALAPLTIITLYPPLLGWIVRTALRVLRRPQPNIAFDWPHVRRAVGWSLITWSCFGSQLWLLANSLTDPGLGGWVRSTSAMALAMTLGFLAFLAPSGLGVREAFIVAALTPQLSTGAALGIALLSRFLFTVADVLTAGGAAYAARRETSPAHPVDVEGIHRGDAHDRR